jgi:hypothetical protein
VNRRDATTDYRPAGASDARCRQHHREPCSRCRNFARCSLPVSVRGSVSRYSIGARVLVRRDRLLDVVLQRARRRLVRRDARLQHDERLDDLPPPFVGHAHDAALGDRRVQQQRAFDVGPAML